MATDVNGGAVVPGDIVWCTITNGGSANATGVMLTGAISTNASYVANGTTLNSCPTADVGG